MENPAEAADLNFFCDHDAHTMLVRNTATAAVKKDFLVFAEQPIVVIHESFSGFPIIDGGFAEPSQHQMNPRIYQSTFRKLQKRFPFSDIFCGYLLHSIMTEIVTIIYTNGRHSDFNCSFDCGK